jgi:hypothetical protein
MTENECKEQSTFNVRTNVINISIKLMEVHHVSSLAQFYVGLHLLNRLLAMTSVPSRLLLFSHCNNNSSSSNYQVPHYIVSSIHSSYFFWTEFKHVFVIN